MWITIAVTSVVIDTAREKEYVSTTAAQKFVTILGWYANNTVFTVT